MTGPAGGAEDALEAARRMAARAAEPVLDLCIAGEGNLSVTTADGRLFVTASGARLADLGPGDLVEVRREAILAGLDADTDAAWLEVLLAGRVDAGSARPSVEVGLHAVLSERRGAGVILHTHPTDVLGVLSAGRGEELAGRRLLPDQVVLCGERSRLLPYLDPGRELARTVRELAAGGEADPVWLLSNHGLVCCARDAQTALDMTLMTAKCARVLLAAGPGPALAMPADQVRRIAGREDEHYRRVRLGLVE